MRSVTIEGNSRLQVYERESGQLWQLTFAGESVLKWQDYLVEAIRQEYGREPNRR